jgi:flagellar hook-basal body complex protein FliE
VTIPANAAASAYRAIGQLGQAVGRGGQAAAGAAGAEGDFGSLLREAVGSFATQARQTEARTQAFTAGRAELVDVVTAVAETEVTLETLVSVRDRMIQAYEEIMKMPI